jgi:lysophospholipase L1-like esterase
VLGCPYCGADNTSWMSSDRIHPNAAGYAHVASRWNAELDRMHGSDCSAMRDQ